MTRHRPSNTQSQHTVSVVTPRGQIAGTGHGIWAILTIAIVILACLVVIDRITARGLEWNLRLGQQTAEVEEKPPPGATEYQRSITRLGALASIRLATASRSEEVDDQCRLIDKAGRITEGLYAAGPITRGKFWEITAVPEIRNQAAEVAAAIRQREA